jgi:peptide/nickel transport system substrate-binding protein
MAARPPKASRLRAVRALDAARDRLGAPQNALLDELLAQRIDRRSFLQHGSRLGVGLAVLSELASLAGLGLSSRHARAQGTASGTIRAAVAMPHGAIDPVRVNDSGSYQLLFQVAEYLCVTQPDLTLKPVLAESWSPNADGSVWTFHLRRGVHFHDGHELTAADVVATFDRLTDPAGASNALSVFKGVLSHGATRRVDDHTVAFHLDAPNGNFPYAVSIDNYNAVILPAQPIEDYEKVFAGTGPFRVQGYRAREGASLVRNPDYWGTKALPERAELKFYADLQPRLLALQAGEVDMLDAVPVIMTPALRGNPDIRLIQVRSANHRQLHMRCDRAPFADKRVRQALALSLDRNKLLAGLCRGMGALGNDSPFSPLYPSTERTVTQRVQDIAAARELMRAAGLAQGFDMTLTTERYADIAEYAQLVQNFARAIDVRITLKIETQALYYGKSVPGQSDWLDSPLGITDYAHRGVPNALLQNPLMSDGPWNAAHFKSAAYDALVPRYVRALDLEAQRSAAAAIQRLLLDETPLVISYFPDLLVPVRKDIAGLPPIAAGLLLDRVHRI